MWWCIALAFFLVFFFMFGAGEGNNWDQETQNRINVYKMNRADYLRRKRAHDRSYRR
jgi:hypothetical protein